MRRLLKWAVRILLMAILAAAVIGFWKREEIMRLMAVNSLFSEDKIVGNFSHMNDAFLSREIPRGDGPISPLPYGAPMTLPEGTDAWIKERAVTSLLVLKDGQIVYEDYFLGTTEDDLRISWSVAKSFLSALMGIIVEEGAIASLDDPVTRYAPQLKGGAYDGATIRNVLQMSSGVTFDEDYLDYDSDINRMGRVLALGGRMDDFAASLTETFTAPGTQMQYTSIDTHVLGMVIRGATGRDIPALLSEKIIAPLGVEATPYYVTDGVGVVFVLGGLNLRTRDYARFGQMIEQDGMWQGKQIVPADWIDTAIRPTAKTSPGEIGYGYQWWVPVGAVPGREVTGRGVYGQYLYIDKDAHVVIVVTAADRKFRDPGVTDASIDTLRRITQATEAKDGT
ncbi:serine hydrolase domain-containing protein [Pseudosulfitobacter pseudonitzschiae]|uniref:serine hydrolase domain-containing protein n=1 Tax=Pseudosulfitobacter pseudonitzschiae TaxID=1402135 RepID=UPI001AF8B3CE|nr:serine hydrolase [Pseudosulfitobacter pseudonitzschiae]MBM1813994.1 serine hydrolase [Pseudosulfitobacter pseudonitzschiae]MBM1830987.1 serine hydrolase [Pseudosulfitobacter pseudonitzschiae]MBM1835854.1 serine hydrolase [Pseudosulfitobacter pseudonitzschiae]MBM1840700.1 serine hydrolase [Pseudosulfitobacter pseudonitzschiae]MBM1845312.1 serine hydrolase [Pseudosulfitobacter pseudonitzschiae]